MQSELDLQRHCLASKLPDAPAVTALHSKSVADEQVIATLGCTQEALGQAELFPVLFTAGTLPDSWSADTALQSIIVANNKITGTLPSSWSQLSSLVNLDLRSNDLSGPVPDSWRGSAAPGVLPTTGMKSLTTL